MQLELLRQSQQDLEACERDVSGLATGSGKLVGDLERVYSYYWVKTETWLALGETERALGDEASAVTAFRRSKLAFDRLEAFVSEHFPPPPELETLRQRTMSLLLGKAPEHREREQPPVNDRGPRADRDPSLHHPPATTRESSWPLATGDGRPECPSAGTARCPRIDS